MKNISIQIVLLLLISSISFGMGSHGYLEQTVIPCADKKKTYYVDYAVSVIVSTTATQDFLHIRKTVKEAIDHLTKCSFEDGRPDNLYVSLFRMYEDHKQTSYLFDDQFLSHEKTKKELLKLGAEEGEWDCTQAMNKIQEVTGVIK